MADKSVSSVKAGLLEVIKTNLSGDLGNKPGAVLSCGWDALRRGPLYVMGFNPAPGYEDDDRSPYALTEKWDKEKFSCFTDEKWSRHGPWGIREQEAGKDLHQIRVSTIIQDCFQLRPSECFATNAIFIQSPTPSALRPITGLKIRELWDKCWPVHQYLLSIVQPRVILCLGNGQSDSAFSLLNRKTLNPTFCNPLAPKRTSYLWGKWYQTQIEVLDNRVLDVCIIGVPHPSWFRVKEEEKLFKAFCLEKLNGQDQPCANLSGQSASGSPSGQDVD